MSKNIKDILKEDHACLNCVFFEPFEVQKRTDNVIGACKANPPFPAQYYGNDDNKLGVWPTVLGTFWCGIFSNGEEK